MDQSVNSSHRTIDFRLARYQGSRRQLLTPSKQVPGIITHREGLCELAFFFFFFFFPFLKIGDFISCKFSAFFQLEINLILTYKKEFFEK
jgi:hypothetical protein